MLKPFSRRNAAKPVRSKSPSSVALLRQPWLRDLLLAISSPILLGLAIWLVYGGALAAPFIFDDAGSVLDNSSITRLWPLIGNSQRPGPLNPPNDLPTSGRPLVNLSLALNYHYGQLTPAGYHGFNIVLHLLSTLLLMAIVRRTLCLDYFRGRFQRASAPLAFLVALIWAVHPLQTEAVVYVTQRTELLVGFFYLATLYGGLRYWAASSRIARTCWLLIATLSCAAGMGCKEVMVTAPVAVLLFERAFMRDSFTSALRKSWPLYLGLALGWAILILLNYSAPRSETAGFHLGIPVFAWWLTQAKVLLLYLKLTLWPWPLSIHYDMPYLTLNAAWPWLLPVVVLAIAILWLFWQRNAAGFVGAVLFLILSPTLVVPIATEVAAERRMYLPLGVLIALAVVGGYWLLRRCNRGTEADEGKLSLWPEAMLAAIAISLALLAAAVSVKRVALYDDTVALWEETLQQTPNSWLAHDNLGSALVDRGQFDEAVAEYQAALAINPDYALSRNNLGMLFTKRGRMPEAIQHLEQAVRLKPRYAKACYNLGNAYKQTGRLSEAIEQYNRALALDPDYLKVRNNLGNAFKQQGRVSEAVEQYRQAIAIKPDYTEAWINLASALSQLDQSADAVAAGETALRLARAQGQTSFVQRMEAWLKAYRAGEIRTTRTPQPQQENPLGP